MRVSHYALVLSVQHRDDARPDKTELATYLQSQLGIPEHPGDDPTAPYWLIDSAVCDLSEPELREMSVDDLLEDYTGPTQGTTEPIE